MRFDWLVFEASGNVLWVKADLAERYVCVERSIAVLGQLLEKPHD